MVALIAAFSIVLAATQVSAVAVLRNMLFSRQVKIGDTPVACTSTCGPHLFNVDYCETSSDKWACFCTETAGTYAAQCYNCIIHADPSLKPAIQVDLNSINNNCSTSGHAISPIQITPA